MAGIDGASNEVEGAPAADWLDEPRIVIDHGTGRIKAGYNTNLNPSLVFPTVLGRPRPRYVSIYEPDAILIGEEAIAQQKHLSMTCPIDHGNFDDMVDMAEIWNYVFAALQADPASTPVLCTEPPLPLPRQREQMTEAMFEVYDVPELSITTSGLLVAYGVGRTTAFVVDIGEGITQCVPVVDGYLEAHTIRRSDFAGEDLTSYLQKLLCDMGFPLTTREERDLVRMLKESVCYCSLHPSSDQERTDIERVFDFPQGVVLRDGITTSITLGAERFYPAEALFNPFICKKENPGLTELIWSSIYKSSIENRKTLLSSVVLAGGSTKFPGLPERLLKELQNTAPEQARNAIQIYAVEDRDLLAWRGGQIFTQSNLRSLQGHLWMTRDEWQEEGPSLCHRKAAIRS